MTVEVASLGCACNRTSDGQPQGLRVVQGRAGGRLCRRGAGAHRRLRHLPHPDGPDADRADARRRSGGDDRQRRARRLPHLRGRLGDRRPRPRPPAGAGGGPPAYPHRRAVQHRRGDARDPRRGHRQRHARPRPRQLVLDAHARDRRHLACRSPRPMSTSRSSSFGSDLAGVKARDRAAREILLRGPRPLPVFPDHARGLARPARHVPGQGRRLDPGLSAPGGSETEYPPVPLDALGDAKAQPNKPVLIAPGKTNIIGGIVRLADYDDVFLYVAPADRSEGPRLPLDDERERQRIPELEATRFGIQIAFGILYLGIIAGRAAVGDLARHRPCQPAGRADPPADRRRQAGLAAAISRSRCRRAAPTATSARSARPSTP